MFADFVLHRKNWLHKTLFDNFGEIERNLYSSKIYRFDKESSRVAAAISHITIDQCLKLIPLAMLPYDNVWVEIDREAYFGELFKNTGQYTDPGTNMAFFYQRLSETVWSVRVVDSSIENDKESVALWPIEFLFDVEGRGDWPEGRLYFKEFSDLAWGYMKDPNSNVEGYDQLLSHVNVAWGVDPQTRKVGFNDIGESRNVAHNIVREVAGTVRRAMILLLMLNAPPVEHVEIKRSGMRVVNQKPRPVLSYRDLRITIPKRRYDYADGILKGLLKQVRHLRRHIVKGHWRRWGDRLVWVRAHERGDASLGYASNRANVVYRPTKVTDEA